MLYISKSQINTFERVRNIMNSYTSKFFKAAFFLVACASSIAAIAKPKKVVADKIVGQVGDKIILRSDVYNSILDAQRQGAQLPPNAECIVMERALIEKALVLQAEKDSL